MFRYFPGAIIALLALSAREAFPATMSLVAVAKNGVPIQPTSNLTVAPGDTVEVEIRLSDWSDDLLEGKLRIFESNIDGVVAAHSGSVGTVLPLGWDAPLTPPTCQNASSCSAEHPVCDAACDMCVGPEHDPSLGVFIDCKAPDHVFAGLDAICDIGSTCYLGDIKHFGVLIDDGVVDPGGGYQALLGRLALQVSDDACGAFIFRFEPYPKTVIAGTDGVDASVFRVPLILNTTPDAEDCNANFVPDECDVADGTSVDDNSNFNPDECDLDLDADGDIDLRDASAMIKCFGIVTSSCSTANFYPGIRVDGADWSAMPPLLNGPVSAQPND